MSVAVPRLLSLRFTKFRGLTNLSSKAFVLKGSDNERLTHLHFGKWDIQENLRGYHTGPSKNVSSINLAAIFNSTKLNIGDRPLVREQFIIDPCVISNFNISDVVINEKVIEEPKQPTVEKRAERMIIIRRKKMKKHKLKKLRKRMKFEWARKAQRREKIKEKAFLAELVGQIKTAENFSPERYAAEQRRIIRQTYLPLRYEEMPQWYYQEVTEKEQRLKREKQEDEERNKLLAEFSKTYKPTLS